MAERGVTCVTHYDENVIRLSMKNDSSSCGMHEHACQAATGQRVGGIQAVSNNTNTPSNHMVPCPLRLEPTGSL